MNKIITKKRQSSYPQIQMPRSLKYRSSVNKVKNRSTRLTAVAAVAAVAAAAAAVTKMGMRQWLEKLLDEDSCKGLAWQNKEKKQFRITWCHASRHDFDEEEHADVFFQYAKFTGRANTIGGSGSRNRGYNSKLKSNFRSALHSLIDCIKVKGTASGGTKEENSIKIYKFVAANHPEYKRRKAEKRNSQKRNKKRKASTKCKPQNDIEVVHVEQVADIDDNSSHHQGISQECHEEIILPDEAQDYLCNLESKCSIPDLATSTILTSSITLSEASISSLPILHPLVKSPDSTPWQLQTIVPLLEASPIFETTLLPLISNVPDFKALGVDDNYTSQDQRVNEILHSGGSVRVKKEEPLAAVEEYIISGLDTADVPSFYSEQNINICLENDPFMNSGVPGESLHQLQPVGHINRFQPEGGSSHQVENWTNSDSTSQSQRVVVQLQQSVLQTDDYRLSWNPEWKLL